MLNMTSFPQARQRKMADRLQWQVNFFVLNCVYQCVPTFFVLQYVPKNPLRTETCSEILIVNFY